MAAQIGLSTIPAVIAPGASLTNQIDIGPGILVGLVIPSGWTSASVTFQASTDGGATWAELYTYAGAELTLTATAGTFLAIDPTQWKGVRSIKLRSGTAASPVNQTSGATVTLVTSL